VGGSRLHVRLRDPAQRARAEAVLASALGGIDAPTGEPARLAGNAPDEGAATRALADLSAAGIRVAEFSLGSPTLDEVFLTLTGKPADDQAAGEGSK
jgi:ABC-2 type transport system ATP-binding protein